MALASDAGAVDTKGTIGAAVVVAAVVVVVGSVQPTFRMFSSDDELLHPKEDLTRSVTTYDMSLNSPRIVGTLLDHLDRRDILAQEVTKQQKK